MAITPTSIAEAQLLRRTLDAARAYPLWIAVLMAGVVVFFGAPGGYANTSYSVLHGLCAQTPSHTFQIGGKPLPFDGRMTGIYGGVAVMFAVLVARGRMFSYGNPPRSVVALLMMFVASMALDGLNSLLTDLGLWHPWTSDNDTRLVTGFAAGIALAIALAWLLASSAWRMSSAAPPVSSLSDLVPCIAGLAGLGVLAHFAPGWMHLPLSVMLVLSAWLTVTLLVLVIVLLALKLDGTVTSLRDLHATGAMAALLATVVMIGLAGLRFWAERQFGISNAMM